MPIRVAIADDSYIVREGIEGLLASIDEVELVASCEDFDSALAAVREHEPQVVLTDIRMPPTNTDEGIRLAAELRECAPGVGVVVLSQHSEPAYVLKLFESGSDGRAYLLKDRVHNRDELLAAVKAVADGGSVVDPKIVEVLVDARKRAEGSPLAELTPREVEVLRALAAGKSNAAIAEELVLTKRAVEKHINAIFLKLDFTYAPDAESISKRVMAALIFLAESDLRDREG